MQVNVAMAASKASFQLLTLSLPPPYLLTLRGEMPLHTCTEQSVCDLGILSDILPDLQNGVNWPTKTVEDEGHDSWCPLTSPLSSFPACTWDDRGQTGADSAWMARGEGGAEVSADASIFADLDGIPAKTMSCGRPLEALCLVLLASL